MTIWQYPRMKLILLSIFTLILFSNYFELKWEAYLTSKFVGNFILRNDEVYYSAIQWYLFWIIGHYILGASYLTIFYYCVPGLDSFVAKRFHDCYLKANYKDYICIGSGRINTNIIKQTDSIINLFEIVVLKFGCDLVFFALMVYKVVHDIKDLKLATFLVCLITVLILCAFQSVVYSTKLRSLQVRDLGTRMNKQHDLIRNYPVIKAYNNGDLEIKKLEKESQDYIIASRRFNMLGRVFDLTFRLIIVFGVVIMSYGVYFGVVFNKMDFGTASFLFSSLIKSIKGRTTPLKDTIFKISESYADLLAYKIPDAEDDSGLEEIKDFKNNIAFNHVSIEKGIRPLFYNFTSIIKAGQKVAITGKNGTGKSSILEVLLKFNTYTGSIEIDGHQISKINGKSLRDIISYIPQEFMITAGSVYENLCYSNPNLSFEKIQKICMEFGCHEMFMSLKDGYYTQVGEQGKFLSGGQNQMINFMRGVIKNAPIFILDEPTSNLDIDFSSQLIDMIFSNLSNKTVFMTTHDPEHLKRFDVILHLNNKAVTPYYSYSEFIKRVDYSELI